MANECPMKIMDNLNGTKCQDSTSFSEVEPHFQLFSKQFEIGDQANMFPSRGGSAPPGMEIFNNIFSRCISSSSSEVHKLNKEGCGFQLERELCAYPDYLAYYCSNMNLNPRLPRPLMSREDRRVWYHMSIRSRWRQFQSDFRRKMVKSGKISCSPHEESDFKSCPEVNSLAEVGLEQDNSLSSFHRNLPDVMQITTQSHWSDFGTEEITNKANANISSISNLDISTLTEPDFALCKDLAQYDRIGSKDKVVESDPSNVGSAPTICESVDRQESGVQDPVRHAQSSTTGLSPLRAFSTSYVRSETPRCPNSPPLDLYCAQDSALGCSFGSGYAPPVMSGYSFHNYSGISAVEFLPGETKKHMEKKYGQQQLMWHAFPYSCQFYYFQHPLGATVPHDPLLGHTIAWGRNDPFVPAMSLSPSLVNNGISLGPSVNRHVLGHGGLLLADSKYLDGSHGISYRPQGPASSHLHSQLLPSFSSFEATHLEKNQAVPSQDFGRNKVQFVGGQWLPGLNNSGVRKRHVILEQIRSSNTPELELSDVTDHIVEFSMDQHGSRYIQKKLENSSPEEKEIVYKKVLPNYLKLMTNVFGNYVVQKFFEYGSTQQHSELADQFVGQMLYLSLQTYGCRVVQKALEVIDLERKIKLVQELNGHIIRCAYDQNGNHVIQKCIECLQAKYINFIISSFKGQVVNLSKHPYGCRVIQRMLEHCLDEARSLFIVEEVLESAVALSEDPYGNYVIQHIISKGQNNERSFIIHKLLGRIVLMSQQKYASNVVEKCLEYGAEDDRDLLIQEILDQPEVLIRDRFGNYVVQKVLDFGNDDQIMNLWYYIKPHHNELKKLNHGNQIFARFEQFCRQEGSWL